MQTNDVKTFAKGLVGTARTILTLKSGSEDSRFSTEVKTFISKTLTKVLMQGINEGLSALFSG